MVRITDTSSPSLRLTIRGASWNSATLENAIGWPTNSGRCSISSFNPKNPRLITAQLTTAAAIGANKGEEDRSEVEGPEAVGFGFSLITIQRLKLIPLPRICADGNSPQVKD